MFYNAPAVQGGILSHGILCKLVKGCVPAYLLRHLEQTPLIHIADIHPDERRDEQWWPAHVGAPAFVCVLRIPHGIH